MRFFAEPRPSVTGRQKDSIENTHFLQEWTELVQSCRKVYKEWVAPLAEKRYSEEEENRIWHEFWAICLKAVLESAEYLGTLPPPLLETNTAYEPRTPNGQPAVMYVEYEAKIGAILTVGAVPFLKEYYLPFLENEGIARKAIGYMVSSYFAHEMHHVRMVRKMEHNYSFDQQFAYEGRRMEKAAHLFSEVWLKNQKPNSVSDRIALVIARLYSSRSHAAFLSKYKQERSRKDNV